MNVNTENSRDVIKLFVALNTFGYNDENNSKGMFPVRKKARGVLVELNLVDRHPILRKLLSQYHPWKLLQFLFLHQKTDSDFIDLNRELNMFCNESGVIDVCKSLGIIQNEEITKRLQPFQKEAFNYFLLSGKSLRT